MQAKNLKKLLIIVLLSACFFGFAATQDLSAQVLELIKLRHNVMGNAMDGLEAYKRTVQVKCKGAILDHCSLSSPPIEEIQICLYSKYGELSGACAMFLSNTPLVFPPLTEDKMVTGISFPKGTVVHMSRGRTLSAQVPKPWKFSNKSCGAGQVSFSHWEKHAKDKIKVSHCKTP